MPYKNIEEKRAYHRQYYQDHKEQFLTYIRQYRQEHKEQHNTYNKRWDKEHPEQARAADKRYQQKHKEEIKTQKKEYLLRKKMEVLTYYGNGSLACVYCGNNNIKVLCIDHINGGGNQQRKNIGVFGGYSFYLWLIRMGYPEGYQTLCANCNTEKEFDRRAGL